MAAKKTGRLDLHDAWNTERACNLGMYPFPEEVEYANPKNDKGEDLFIYGSNTREKTTIEVYYKRRPLPRSSGRFDPEKDQVEVKFRLDDGTGNLYWMEERDVVPFSVNEYKAAGFAFESLQANRIGRIKFLGYLRCNDENKLYYVQIRFLCLFFSKTFDHQTLHNDTILLKEMALLNAAFTDLLEDKLEQFCQIKGTFKVESAKEKELFFLGTVGRRFGPNRGNRQIRKIVKIFGFDREGFGFQVGLIWTGNFHYRYGFMSKDGDNFKLMKYITLTAEAFDKVAFSNDLLFEVKFEKDPKTYKFEVNQYMDNRRLLFINGVEGLCFIVEQMIEDVDHMDYLERRDLIAILERSWQEELIYILVVGIEEDCARVTDLTGGKGASLAQMTQLSMGTSWEVPKAIVVTTSAYRVQTKVITWFEHNLDVFQKNVRDKNNVKKVCEEMENWFSTHELNEKIKRAIEDKMNTQFGCNWTDKLFAVRSSAVVEVSRELSASGQMKTFLGIRSLANLFNAVVKCWASQFGFVPVEYKRSYGQALNAPMAVVIQEMVDCDCAGVVSTADPTNGDERILTVTSNFGLGESMCFPSADPDTFKLAIEIKANSYKEERKVVSILSKTIGKKSLVTRLNRNVPTNLTFSNGVFNEHVIDVAVIQSLSDDDIIRIANIALEQHYSNPRDIEWGLKDGQMYILQSRPITNLDSTFTDYELMHEMDTPHMSELEIYSRAHWRDIFPSASSWISNFLFMNSNIFMQNSVSLRISKLKQDFNPNLSMFGVVCNQQMFNMKLGPMQPLLNGYPKSALSVASVLSYFGHHINDKDVLEALCLARSKHRTLSFSMNKMKAIGRMLFLSDRNILRVKQQFFQDNYSEFASSMKTIPLEEKLDFVYHNVMTLQSPFKVYGPSTFCSIVYSMLLLKMLNSSSDTSNVELDYNLLMSHCNDAVSSDIPNMLKNVARAIKNKESFAQLTDEEALKILQSKYEKESHASNLFTEFLNKHGHRGYGELEVMNLSWGKNPIPCVQVIKALLNGHCSLYPRPPKSISQVMREIKTPLSTFKKMLIRRWLLPRCIDAVGYRENTKSILVKFLDNIRSAIWQIAEDLAREGLLPEPDLMFYLKLDEIKRITNGERNLLLVMKAKQRKLLFSTTMEKLKFDEFVKGFRMQPMNEKLFKPVNRLFLLKGTSIAFGKVKARVCVAESIKETENIQQGDILIAYSIDISWSPYFPMVSGVVTEIGSTMSHGAMIAREFGIPCLIAVENVCNHFQTGDIAYIDTKTDSIIKVVE